MTKDLEANSEFRIKYPRGQLGQSSGEQELYMLVEDLYKSVDRLNKAIEDGMHNKVNIEFIRKQLDKALIDIEELKDKNREIVYKNGN
jgi:flagellin-specific chaperone FliS